MGIPADQIQQLLAAYMQAGPSQGSPSQVGTQFGGLANLGMSLLANSGPSPVRPRFGQVLGNSMLQSQNTALAQAKARQDMVANSVALRNQLAMLQMLSNPNAAGQGTGLPIDDSSDSGSSQDPSQQTQTPNGTPVAPGGSAAAPTGGLSPVLQALQAGNAAPPGAAPLNAPSAAPPGAALVQASSAAPPGAPVQRQQILPPSGSGQFPAGFNPMQRVRSATAAPNWLTPPTASQIAGVPVSGFNPNTLQTLSVLRGGDPIATAGKIREQQLQIAQQKYAPAIAQLDTIAKSDSPTKYVQASPQLSAAWQRIAPQLGMDPQKDFNDQNVRTAFTFARNNLAGALSEATVAPNVPLKSTPIGLGGTIQTDPVTGKVTAGAPQQETAQFVMPDGSVRLLPKAQGIARGLAPYDVGTYVNQAAIGPSVAAIAAYKAPPLTGQALRTAQGQTTMAQVYKTNPQYDATQYDVKQKAREDFATGAQGDTVRSLSVATDHLNQLLTAGTALNNKNFKAYNSAMNYLAQQFGSATVPSFDAMKELVGDEVAKAVIGGAGAEGDRDAIKQGFATASPQGSLQGVVAKYKGLMGGQLSGLRRQYQTSTGLNDFNDMLSPAAQSQLGGSAKTGPMGVGQSTNLSGFTITRTQ